MGWYRHRPMARWFEGWSGSEYLPWERWLMSRPQCRAVFPRDSFTTEVLEQWQIPLFDLGNPMMDDLQSPSLELCTVTPISPIETQGETQQEMQRPALTIVLMPGSRQPEAFNNWQLILQAVHILIRAISHNAISQDVNGFLSLSSKDLWNNSESDFPVGHFQADRQPNPPIKLLFLAAIAPGLEIAPICQSLTQQEWQLIQNQEFQDRELKRQLDSALNGEKLQFQQGIAQLVIARAAFNQCIQQADLAIAMAGTATEQFVGLGKPAITLPGAGPQFTYRFAEAQQRLLGESVVLANSPAEIPEIVRSLLGDTNRLKRIAANGQRRMGQPGAAHRIAACFLKQMENSND
ncbi:MAG: lipid-A-disaccharide synthase-related protein [Microcoleaceae cyanobacterium]